MPEPSNPVHLSGVTGRLELKKASFRYGTRAVTKDVDLIIEPGEMIAWSAIPAPASLRWST